MLDSGDRKNLQDSAATIAAGMLAGDPDLAPRVLNSENIQERIAKAATRIALQIRKEIQEIK